MRRRCWPKPDKGPAGMLRAECGSPLPDQESMVPSFVILNTARGAAATMIKERASSATRSAGAVVADCDLRWPVTMPSCCYQGRPPEFRQSGPTILPVPKRFPPPNESGFSCNRQRCPSAPRRRVPTPECYRIQERRAVCCQLQALVGRLLPLGPEFRAGDLIMLRHGPCRAAASQHPVCAVRRYRRRVY